MSSKDDYPYPEDEFDALGQDRAPQGVHRAPPPRWRQLLPFIIVLVLAPTLAFVAVRLVSGGNDDPDPTTTTSQEPTTDEPTDPDTGSSTDESTDTTTDAGSEDPKDETSEPTGDLDYATQIWVLNGSGVSGLAADTAAALEADGWQDVNPADYNRAQPSATTIFYDNADQVDEAQAVADALGITALSENADAADGDIVIVLRTDFQLP